MKVSDLKEAVAIAEKLEKIDRWLASSLRESHNFTFPVFNKGPNTNSNVYNVFLAIDLVRKTFEMQKVLWERERERLLRRAAQIGLVYPDPNLKQCQESKDNG